MTKKITNLTDHQVLCGAGQTGLHIAEEFCHSQTPVAVIDLNPAAIARLQARLGCDIFCIVGDATEDEILEQAGISRARGFIAALSDDKDNIFAVLTARSLNPNLRIVAQVNNEDNAEKLRQAGADVITAPNQVGGMRMASEMIRPEVVEFLDQMLHASDRQQKLRLTEIPVDKVKLQIPVMGQVTIADFGRQTELLIIAIKRDEQYIYRPRGNMVLRRSAGAQAGDVLIVIATQDQLDLSTGGQQ